MKSPEGGLARRVSLSCRTPRDEPASLEAYTGGRKEKESATPCESER